MKTSTNRTTGLVYLAYFATAIIGLFLASSHVEPAGLIMNLLSVGCYAAVTVLFYWLFRPVNAVISLLAALLSLIGCVATTLQLLHVQMGAPGNPLIYFGAYCILLGWLIVKSAFLPRVFGIVMIIAGIGWLLTLTPIMTRINAPIKAIGFFAELSLMLWLVIKGVPENSSRDRTG